VRLGSLRLLRWVASVPSALGFRAPAAPPWRLRSGFVSRSYSLATSKLQIFMMARGEYLEEFD
ncbi:hypothetical protein J7361_21415, partial [Xanthomonas phaseoli pv. dieffenbachiae]